MRFSKKWPDIATLEAFSSGHFRLRGRGKKSQNRNVRRTLIVIDPLAVWYIFAEGSGARSRPAALASFAFATDSCS